MEKEAVELLRIAKLLVAVNLPDQGAYLLEKTVTIGLGAWRVKLNPGVYYVMKFPQSKRWLVNGPSALLQRWGKNGIDDIVLPVKGRDGKKEILDFNWNGQDRDTAKLVGPFLQNSKKISDKEARRIVEEKA